MDGRIKLQRYLIAALTVWSGAGAAAEAAPSVTISLQSATLRLTEDTAAGGRRHRVFPVGVGRIARDEALGPGRGRLFTGRDPRDRFFFDPARRLPAFHRGLPFIRLDLPRGRRPGGPRHPFGIHGPVTPSLIWGHVSAGCVRMRAEDIRELFAVARRNPRMPVRFIGGADPVRPPAGPPACPEAALGARRLGRLRAGQLQHARICGGVDHWYAVTLQAGDTLSAELNHGGRLRLELYGIRAISTVARGRYALRHRVPLARKNRGDRFVRVVAADDRAAVVPYTLRIERR